MCKWFLEFLIFQSGYFDFFSSQPRPFAAKFWLNGRTAKINILSAIQFSIVSKPVQLCTQFYQFKSMCFPISTNTLIFIKCFTFIGMRINFINLNLNLIRKFFNLGKGLFRHKGWEKLD